MAFLADEVEEIIESALDGTLGEKELEKAEFARLADYELLRAVLRHQSPQMRVDASIDVTVGLQLDVGQRQILLPQLCGVVAHRGQEQGDARLVRPYVSGLTCGFDHDNAVDVGINAGERRIVRIELIAKYQY